MPLSAEQYQELVVSEVGDVDNVVSSQIATFWDLYGSETDMYPQYLLAKRKSLDVLMGYVREQVDQSDLGAEVKLGQKLANLQTMWKNVDGEIAELRAEAKEIAQQTASSGHRPLTGQLTARLGGPSGFTR